MSSSTLVFLKTFLFCAVAAAVLTGILAGVVAGNASVTITCGLLAVMCAAVIFALRRQSSSD